uniref:Uncharacterized protein n=1 Tax=Globisporangium ultimum (strain ATCC 200006 / CBS 805.95 / DAOM BR144) TaxID=431595 RepID=K3WTZ1_GLOUD
MVLPVIIAGGLVTGGVTGYGMYHLGEALALPPKTKEAPPKTALSVTAGVVTAGVAYSAQRRLLNQRFAHLLTYEVPVQVAHWGFRDFLRVTGPFIGTRVVMVSTSVAIMGFVATKIDVLHAKK